MGRKKKVKCTKCNKPLFYLPSNYDMGMDVICVECTDGKKKPTTKKKTRQTASGRYANVKRGPRPDLGDEFWRSPSEANFARVMKHLGIEYEFEKRTFFFHDYKVKPFQYTPDFKITTSNNPDWPTDAWIEVKGYMDSASRGKLKRFKKCYPEDASKMIVVLHKNKTAESFCKKNKISYVLYEDLINRYRDVIPTLE